MDWGMDGEEEGNGRKGWQKKGVGEDGVAGLRYGQCRTIHGFRSDNHIVHIL
jgi:hypothetical protein